MSENMNVQEVPIYSLYTMEKEISLSDDKGRKSVILLVKMNQREKKTAYDIYIKAKNAEEKKLRQDELDNQTQSKVISLPTKEQLITEILDYEKAQRMRYAYLYPLKDEEKLTEEEKKKEIDDLAKKWEEERRKTLEPEKIEDLRIMLVDYTIEGLSIIEAGRIYDYASLSFMCRDLKTKSRIFKDYTQLEEVQDLRVLNWLSKELREFNKITIINEEDQIKEAKSGDFFTSGESPK